MNDLDRLATITAGDFMPHVNRIFQAFYNETEFIELTLKSVTEFPASYARVGARLGFSLIFHNGGTRFFEQSVVRMVHPIIGELLVLIVPMSHNAQGRTYEVIFN